MTKEEAKQKLRKSGYNVIEDNSVVTVLISPDSNMKNVIRDIKEKLYSWGYDASFGVKQHKGAEEVVAVDDIENDILEDSGISEAVDDSAETEEINKFKSKSEKIKLEDVIAASGDEDAKKTTLETVESVKSVKDTENADEDDEWFDEEDSDMLLTEESIQFSLEDFGLDF